MRVGGRAEIPDEQVRVRSEGDADVAVPHEALHAVRVHSAAEELGCEGVAQVVEADGNVQGDGPEPPSACLGEWTAPPIGDLGCAACGDELLVAFSCKGRGFCPSCTSRCMHDTAARLVDRVIRQVPVRQWVLSLPRWARFLLARDPRLITRTLDLALRAIFAQQRRRARRAGALAPRRGAATFVQRFGGALSLNAHFHCIIPDGVFVREDGQVRFVGLAPPCDDDVMVVLRRIVARLELLQWPRRLR